MLEKFKQHAFRATSLDQIAQANSIIDEYLAEDLILNLRQLFYQFVSRNMAPNSQKTYKCLGNLLSKGREAGLVPWDAIEDRGRQALKVIGESNPRDVVNGLEHSIVIDPWQHQDFYIEVWIEKDALVGTIENVCNEHRVTYMACRGYLSASEAWRAGHRFRHAARNGKQPLILHLGDHDPSGIDMTRDNQDRSTLFARHEVPVQRIALNMDQILQYKPPPNPAKMTDTRAADYVSRHGESSWELDALEPRILAALVRQHITSCITDQAAWDEVSAREETAKTHLGQLHSRWDDVVRFLEQTEEPA